jgi:hypothetical protein
MAILLIFRNNFFFEKLLTNAFWCCIFAEEKTIYGND